MPSKAQIILFWLLFFVMSACTKDPVYKDELFEVEMLREYVIDLGENEKQEDTESGTVFRFPQGANGVLKMGVITDGPDFDEISAIRYFIDYEGDGEVEWMIPLEEGYYLQAFVYGPIEGASLKANEGKNSWGTMIEQDTVDNYLRFVLDPGGLKSSGTKYNPPDSKYFAIAKLSKESNDWNKLVSFYHSIKQVVELWLKPLPAERQEELRLLMNTSMKFDVRLSGGNCYYQHFDNWVWGKNAIFYLTPSTLLPGIAHETGHYMNHLISGYDRYAEIYDRVPKEYWGLGGSVEHFFGEILGDRLYLLEDYAHFSEFLAIGTMSNYDMYNTNGPNYFSMAMDDNMPDVKDYPSHEGFGTAMLAALMRTEDMIFTYDKSSKTKERVPVFQVPLTDIIDVILAPGPADVNELYQNIYNYLSRSIDYDVDMLAAALQPLGWTYKGRGILVDEEGQPIPGLKVRPVVLADQVYRGELSAATNDQGEFSITGLPPGNFALRVYGNSEGSDGEFKDSLDISLSIDYQKLTTEEIEFDPIEVEFTDQLEKHVISRIFDTDVYDPGSDYTGPKITSQLDFFAEYTISSKNIHTLSGSHSLINFYIDCRTDSPVTADFAFKWSMSDYTWEWVNVVQDIYTKYAVTLSPIPEIVEEDYGEGGFAPHFSYFQEADGSVKARLFFYPDSLFDNVNSRRFRLYAKFTGTQELYFTSGDKNSHETYYIPSSIDISVSKGY